MRIAVLGEGTTCSLLIQQHGVHILLDCSAEPRLSVAPRPSPQQHDLSCSSTQQLAVCLQVPDLQRLTQTQQQLHAVLFSNPYALLAVPHLQQLLQQNGQKLPLHFYCTEPCYHGFQHLALELLQTNGILQQQQRQCVAQLAPSQLSVFQQQMEMHQQLQLQLQQQQKQALYNGHGILQHQQQTSKFWHHNQQQQQPAGFGNHGIPLPRPPPGSPPPAAAAVPGSVLGVPPPQPPPGSPPAGTANAATAAAVQQCGTSTVPPPQPPPGSPPAAAAGQRQQQQQQRHLVVPLFTQQQLDTVLNALQVVRLGQRVQLPGCWCLTAEARPAGSSIGCAVWLLAAGSQRITYLSPASLHPNHCAPLHKPSLQNLDALIIGPGSICPDLTTAAAAEQQQQYMMQTAVGAVVRTVLNGGRVLIPVLPAGSAVLLLLEQISNALHNTSVAVAGAPAAAAAAAVPLFYLSPAAPDALATASSCCEYLEPHRKQGVLIHGQAPFAHDMLLQSGQLKLFTGSQHYNNNASKHDAIATSRTTDNIVSTAHTAAASKVTDVAAAAAAAAAMDHPAVGMLYSGDLQQVLTAGPCVAFVSLWSLAAGPGQQLAQQWSSNPNNLLLLPEQGPPSASWLQQCMQQQLMPQQQHASWQVQFCPITSTAGIAAAAAGQLTAVGGSCPAVEGCLTARQLIQLLVMSQHSTGSEGAKTTRLLLNHADRKLLENTLQAERLQLKSYSLTTLLSNVQGPIDSDEIAAGRISKGISFQLVDLPHPLIEVLLSKDLAKNLHLTPLVTAPLAGATSAAGAPCTDATSALGALQGVATSAPAVTHAADVSVARVRGLLVHEGGVWRLDPLPGGTKVEAVAAAVDQQQQGDAGMMVWGSVELTALLGDLQAAGFTSLYVDCVATTNEDGRSELARVIKLSAADGDAEIWLSQDSTEVVCDSWVLRKQLLDLVMRQLHVIS